LYSGEQFDSKIGQQYLRQRYYDPATGRFNRLDPFFGNISDPLSLHKYTYTHNNPINMTDPTGLFGAMSIGISIGIGALSGGLIMGGATLVTTRSFELAGQAFLKGAILGAIAGATFPIVAAGIGWTATALGASKGLSLGLAFWGASTASGAIPSYLESIWQGNDPLGTTALTDAAIGGGTGLITVGVFKGIVGAVRSSYGFRIPETGSIDDIALQKTMERVKQLARDPVFLQHSGLQNTPQAQKVFFDLVESQLTPALANDSGAAVGLLNFKQANGEIKTILSLALPKNASDSTIVHELIHTARQAATKSSPKGYDLFLFESSTPNFDPEYWWVFLREESIAHMKTGKIMVTGVDP
jgi:RHS repeat-associated protein